MWLNRCKTFSDWELRRTLLHEALRGCFVVGGLEASEHREYRVMTSLDARLVRAPQVVRAAWHIMCQVWYACPVCSATKATTVVHSSVSVQSACAPRVGDIGCTRGTMR